MEHPYGTPALPQAPAGPLAGALDRSTTHAFATAEELAEFGRGERFGDFYQRNAHSGGMRFEGLVAAREGAEGAVAFASGMAAISAIVLAHCGAGDRVLVARQVYGMTEVFCREELPRFGIRVDRFDALNLETLAAALAEPARLVLLETPINPTLRIVDLGRAVEVAARHEAMIVVDGTLAPAPIQRPLALGAGLVVHSATKFFGGHSDAMAGVVAGAHGVLAPIAKWRTRAGGCLAPDVAWLLCRSMATLDVRLEAQQAAALEIANRLGHREGSGALETVHHPGLPAHPDHALAMGQMAGGPALVSMSVHGGGDGAAEVFDRLQVVGRAPLFGGVESVASLPALTTHAGLTTDDRHGAGIPAGILRISVGLEGAEEIAADLLQALGCH